jgi:hypothetical protein
MNSFAFVVNVASLEVESFTLAPGQVLRRAQPEEIEVIKSTIDRFNGGLHSFAGFTLWEGKLPLAPGKRIEILPEPEWRYFVIAIEGSHETITDIQHASDLASTELEIGFAVLFTFPGSPGGFVFHPGRFFQALEDCNQAAYAQNLQSLVQVSEPVANEIATLCAKLRSADRRLIDVKALAGRMGDLKLLPSRSPLIFLGYFAILESLLSHPPRISDPYDMVIRQVKSKLALLNNRFDRKIDYSRFAGAPAETVWTKMYNYRHSLAQGSTPIFEGDLAVLGSHAHAVGLLKRTVKAILRQALVEPQLLLDLKDY